jgi:hypothetical protein
MVSHIFGCIWIFIGRHEEENGWIVKYDFEGLSEEKLYLAALYFTFTTISTVGYGDISGGNLIEKITCIAYMCIGVGIYSFIAGSITSLLINNERISTRNYQQVSTLHRLFQENEISSTMFHQLRKAINL